MPDICPLRNPIQHYDWGSVTAIPEFLGRPPSREPVAEVWLGAHPKAPSEVRLDDDWTDLLKVLRRDPDTWLGDAWPGDAGRSGEDAEAAHLPFLLKILAAGKPLSIQAHPNLEQARLGFEREEKAGVQRWDPRRNYRDRHHKPEIIYALSPFTVLCGFRPAREILELFATFGLSAPSLTRPLETGDTGVYDFFAALLRSEGTDIVAWVDTATERAAGLEGDEARWVLRMAEEFPADRGVLAPLFLNLSTLAPGEAVFTGPGVLHAYLDGLGIELMANSDNVLRGACTSKHVDPDELLRIVDPVPRRPHFVEPQAGPGCDSFVTPDGALRLSKITVSAGQDFERAPSQRSPQILLSAEGEGRIVVDGQPALPFGRDTSFVVPAATRSYRIEGRGTLFLAEARFLAETGI